MNIKDYRDKELKNYVVGMNILLVLLNYGYIFEIDVSKETIAEIVQVAGIILPIFEALAVSAVVGVFVFVFDSIFSISVKDILTWQRLIKKPGMKVFTKIRDYKIRDDRIDYEKAKKKYKKIIANIPSGKEQYQYQNNKWYIIYNQYEDDNKILVAQRDYLLCRDMCTATATESCAILIGMVLRLIPFGVPILVVLAILYIMTIVATYNKAERFCFNVIAKDLSKSKDNG